MYKCPHCYIQAKTIHGLKKHLSGTYKYGGHELSEFEINEIIFNLTNSNSVLTKVSSLSNPNISVTKPENYYGEFIYDLFLSMLKNKDIPKYQFERRIDTIFELFLPDFLSQYYQGKVEFVVPEFPLKKDNNSQSTNVDYLFHLTKENGANKWVMVELKTDHDSISLNQLETYCKSIKIGMNKIIEDLLVIRNNSLKKHKYNLLIDRIEKYNSNCSLEVIYISPFDTGLVNKFPIIKFITFNDLLKFNPYKYTEVWDLFREIILENF